MCLSAANPHVNARLRVAPDACCQYLVLHTTQLQIPLLEQASLIDFLFRGKLACTLSDRRQPVGVVDVQDIHEAGGQLQPECAHASTIYISDLVASHMQMRSVAWTGTRTLNRPLCTPAE